MVTALMKRSKNAAFSDCKTGSNPVTPMPRNPLENNTSRGFLLEKWAFLEF